MANQDSHEKFAYLDQLSTRELEELIRADLDSPENQNDEAIFHVLEVLNKRAKEDPAGAAFDQARVWQDIQTVYHVPEGEGRSLYPTDEEALPPQREPLPFEGTAARKRHPLWRSLSVAAAAILVFSITVVGAQAAGLDIFGFLANWTAEVFHYRAESQYYAMVRDAFDENHFPVELAPKWYPQGFEAGEPEVVEEEFFTAIYTPFSNNIENKHFLVQVWCYNTPENLIKLNHQRDADSKQEYTSGDKTFLIVTNEGHINATWSDRDTLVMTIIGDLSIQDTKKIIDSIGG